MSRILALLLILVSACAHKNPYEMATESEKAQMKETIIPLKPGTKFRIGYSPFKNNNHNYSWTFNVPFGTPVVSVEDGVVTFIKTDGTRGGCGEENEGHGHIIYILHSDGTVAHYLHLNVLVKKDEKVKKGQVIATTAENGLVCAPNLHFMEFKDAEEIRKGRAGKTIPLRFTGIPGGLAILDYEGTTP